MPIKSRDMIDADDPRVSKFGHPAPPWLVNYADLMTELVCFFIILYALTAALNKGMQKTQKVVGEMIQKGEIRGEAKMTKEGLEISLQEKGDMAFFPSGSAELTPEIKSILDKIAPMLEKVPGDIVVEGHTDNRPIRTIQYPSNWELSTARATNIVRYLVYQKGFSPERLSAVGYGEYKPCAPNDTEENMAKNRRVVFLIKNPPLKPKK